MNIATAIRSAIGKPAPADDSAEAKRLQLLKARAGFETSMAKIAASMIDHEAKRAIAERARMTAAPAIAAYKQGRVAASLGETLPVPLEQLKRQAEAAERTANEMADVEAEAAEAKAILADSLQPLREGRAEIQRELAAIFPAVLDERMAALLPKYSAVSAALTEVLDELDVLASLFDENSIATGSGQFRGSERFAGFLIPKPMHPAFETEYPDNFARAKALNLAHEAYRDKLRKRDAHMAAIRHSYQHGPLE